MFDVIWTDPDRELLGEHRAKKERRRGQKEKEKEKERERDSKDGKKRSSLSTKRSSLSSSGDSPFAFLRSHGLKRINTSDANSRARSSASSRLASPSVSSARSPHSTTFDTTRSRPSSGLAATCSSEEPISGVALVQKFREGADGEHLSSGVSLHDSVISRHSDGEFAAPLFNHASKESSKAYTAETMQKHHSQPAGLNETLAYNGPAKSTPKDSSGINHGQESNHSYENATWPRTSKRQRAPVYPHSVMSSPAMQLSGPLPPISPLRLNKAKVAESTQKSTDALTSPRKTQQSTIAVLEDMLARCSIKSFAMNEDLDIEAWSRSIEKMSTTGIDDMVLRLKEIADSARDQTNVAAIEAEGVRWTLWALDHLDPVPLIDHSPLRTVRTTDRSCHRMLLLYEPHDTTAYQIAINPDITIDHVSTASLPSSFATNLHSIYSRTTCPSDFPPLTEAHYDRIVSYYLPATFPAEEVPPVLSRLHTCLRPGGTLCLLLIDPTPRPGTAGPLLRAWLKRNVLCSLQRASRCYKPSKLFPRWLADASLRGEGSTITTTKFYAVPGSAHLQHFSRGEGEEEKDVTGEEVLYQKGLSERVAKAEARSLIGRLLWKNVWGSFVTEDQWWWEDDECVRECMEMGTIWEYSIIEAVKGLS